MKRFWGNSIEKEVDITWLRLVGGEGHLGIHGTSHCPRVFN